jgi:hypothetical protein
MRKDGLRALYSMDIRRATLFLGLEGFAESLGVYKIVLDHHIE